MSGSFHVHSGRTHLMWRTFSWFLLLRPFETDLHILNYNLFTGCHYDFSFLSIFTYMLVGKLSSKSYISPTYHYISPTYHFGKIFFPKNKNLWSERMWNDELRNACLSFFVVGNDQNCDEPIPICFLNMSNFSYLYVLKNLKRRYHKSTFLTGNFSNI